jgi:hypothetical protein
MKSRYRRCSENPLAHGNWSKKPNLIWSSPARLLVTGAPIGSTGASECHPQGGLGSNARQRRSPTRRSFNVAARTARSTPGPFRLPASGVPTRAPLSVIEARFSALPSERLVSSGDIPLHRPILAHLERPIADLDVRPGTPSRHESRGQRQEVDRDRIIDNPAQPGRSHRPAIGAAVLVKPNMDLGQPFAKAPDRNVGA